MRHGESLTAVLADDVRDLLHLSNSDISDDKTLKMIKRAAIIVSLELSEKIEYSNCSEPQKEAITLLAAMHTICYLTGGSAIGLNFSVGDLTSSTSTFPTLTVLQSGFERVLASLKEPYVGSV
jgi:hypothetical protein